MQETIKMINQNSVTPEEFEQAVSEIIKFVKIIKEQNDSDRAELAQKIEATLERIKSEVKNGEDYVLTPQDKREIAGLIEVPVVEKIIEKTETIIEKPITNEVPNRDTAEDIRNKLELLDGDERLKKEAISGLEDVIGQKDLDFALGVLDKRTQFLVNKPPQITVSTTAPDSPYVNQLWVDLS